MEIHKPKPWHGIREFLKEYLIIVAGVLTALAGEQIVSSIEWHNRVVEAREDLAVELAEDMGKMTSRVIYGPCIGHRLDDIAEVIDRSAESGRLPPLPTPLPPIYHSWATGVWQSLQSGQTAAHMTRDELRTYARIYQIIERVNQSDSAELQAWTILYGLAGPGRPFSRSEAQAYREAVARARTENGLQAGFGIRAHQVADPHHVGYTLPSYWLRVNGARRSQKCRGFGTGTPPAHYGASPTSDFPDIARQHPLSE